MKRIMSWFREEDGVVSIEYGLIAAAIAVVIAGVVYLIGDEVGNIFDEILTALVNRG